MPQTQKSQTSDVEKCGIEKKITDYIDVLLKAILLKKDFFVNNEGLGFIFESSSYCCHICNLEVPLKESPGKSVKNIIDHVNSCRFSKPEEAKTNSLVEFSVTYKSLLKISTLIKESLKFIKEDSSSNIYRCKICDWTTSLLSRKKFYKHLHHLTFHVQTYHCEGFARYGDHFKGKDSECISKHGSDFVQEKNSECNSKCSSDIVPKKDFVSKEDILFWKKTKNKGVKEIEEVVINYLDEIIKMIHYNKEFFQNEGRVSGFCLNFSKYVCHLCIKAISFHEMSSFSGKSVFSLIFNHVQSCKGRKKGKNYNKLVEDTRISSHEFGNIYETMLTTMTLIKQSFTFLQVFCNIQKIFICKSCKWKSQLNISCFDQVLTRLLLHLQNNHYHSPALFAFSGEEDSTCAGNSPVIVLNSVYEYFKRDNETIETWKSIWMYKDDELNCSFCKLSFGYVGDVMKLREILLCHSKFHKRIHQQEKGLLVASIDTFQWNPPSPENNVKQVKQPSEKLQEQNKKWLDHLFRTLNQFNSEISNSRAAWVIVSEPGDNHFSCNFCNCTISVKKCLHKQVSYFLSSHFKRSEHYLPLKENHTLNKELKSYLTNSEIEVCEILKTLDVTDQLIKLSLNCFVKVSKRRQCCCNLCNVAIYKRSDVFEFRYLLWEHINSATHKSHFPQIQEDLQNMKTRLSKVLQPDFKSHLDHIQIGPGTFVKCGICQTAVPMRFYALKNHIEGQCPFQETLKGKTAESVAKHNDKRFSHLNETVPEIMRSDLKYIKMGEIPGFVKCSLCACAIAYGSKHNVEAHLAGTDHIQNRGGIWYE